MALNKDRLIELLNKNNMSYQDLADITHINKATLHRYFTGATKKIPIERLWPIAFALNTTPQYIMNDTDNPDPPYHFDPCNILYERIASEIKNLSDIELKSVLAFIKMMKSENP